LIGDTARQAVIAKVGGRYTHACSSKYHGTQVVDAAPGLEGRYQTRLIRIFSETIENPGQPQRLSVICCSPGFFRWPGHLGRQSYAEQFGTDPDILIFRSVNMDLAVETQIKNRQSKKNILGDFVLLPRPMRPARSFQNRANAVGLLIEQLRHIQQRSGSRLCWICVMMAREQDVIARLEIDFEGSKGAYEPLRVAAIGMIDDGEGDDPLRIYG